MAALPGGPGGTFRFCVHHEFFLNNTNDTMAKHAANNKQYIVEIAWGTMILASNQRVFGRLGGGGDRCCRTATDIGLFISSYLLTD